MSEIQVTKVQATKDILVTVNGSTVNIMNRFDCVEFPARDLPKLIEALQEVEQGLQGPDPLALAAEQVLRLLEGG